MKRVPYTRPSITDLEVQYATDAAENGWGHRCYEYIARFERAFAGYLGVQHAIATSSCTGALHLGLSALGIGPDDEVIMADCNWIATAAPITHLGAKPVFVDILPDSWCLDPKLVEEAITERTKAIVAVHLYGNLCAMNDLMEIGHRHGIPIVEDAAEAIGSVYHGRRAGTLGRFGAFSFHGTKTLTTGEGGLFVTDDDDLYETVLTLSNHGRSSQQPKQFWPDIIGFKYKMSNIQAAIGCAQLERIDELVAAKRDVFIQYQERLKSLPISMNPEPEGTTNGYWMPTAVADPEVPFNLDHALACFRDQNIDARVFFWPLSSLPIFGSHDQESNSRSIQRRAINLPSFHEISEKEIGRVVNTLRAYLESCTHA